jgi:hypothetical protein
MTYLSSTHRNQAIEGLTPNKPNRTCGSDECAEYQDIDALDRDERPNTPIRPCRGSSCRGFAGSPIRSHLGSDRMSPTAGHDAPGDAAWCRSQGNACLVGVPPVFAASSLGLGSRGVRRAMSHSSLLPCSPTFVAITHGTPRRKNCGRAPCLESCGWFARTPRRTTRQAAHVERGYCLADHTGASRLSRIASSKTHEATQRGIAGGGLQSGMLSMGDEREALHTSYNRARLVRNA